MEQIDKLEECFIMQQQLIDVGNSFWDQNWSWRVTKQEIDYKEEKSNRIEVAVATFVHIVNSMGMERENMGYAFISSTEKSLSHHLARKTSIIKALHETLNSFGGEVSQKLNNLEPHNDCTTDKTTRKVNPVRESGAQMSDCSQKSFILPPKQGNQIGASGSICRNNSSNKDQDFNLNQNENAVQNKRLPELQAIQTHIKRVIPNSVGIIASERHVPGVCTKNTPLNALVPGVPIPTASVFYPAVNPPVPVIIPAVPIANTSKTSRQIPSNNPQKPAKKTEEELRLERKRRQREKQEEFQKKQIEGRLNPNAHNPLGIQMDDGGFITADDDASILISTQDFNSVINTAVKSNQHLNSTARPHDVLPRTVPPWITSNSNLKRSSDPCQADACNKRKSGEKQLQFL